MKQASKFLLLLGMTVLMAGCKLAVIVVEGGEVQSDNSGDCEVNSVCLIEITSTNFKDAFAPAEEAGWYFDSWVAGDGFLCGGSTYPTCALNLRKHKGNEAIEELVTLPTTFYLMPKFLPIKMDEVIAEGRTVQIGGREWLQPADTVGYSYKQINEEICPDRLCTGTLLKGNPGSPGAVVDIEGYTWASSEDMHWLAREYRSIGRDPGTDFEPTTSRPSLLYGVVSDAPDNKTSIYVAILGSGAEILRLPLHPDQGAEYVGVWLWRPSK